VQSAMTPGNADSGAVVVDGGTVVVNGGTVEVDVGGSVVATDP